MVETPPDGHAGSSPDTDGWQSVIEDMSATADAYRDRGWTALELHPGDSVLVDSEFRTGLDVVVPGPEFEDLERHVSDADFSDVDVFKAESGGMCYLLVVEKDPDGEIAIFVPAYYDLGEVDGKLETIRADGELHLYCRPLSDEYVEFVHTDLSPFLPGGGGGT